MRLSEKYAVPAELALLYEFVNSVDQRIYIEGGRPHTPSDELATPETFGLWLRARALPSANGVDSYERALELRDALRSFLKVAPEERRKALGVVRRLKEISSSYPLSVDIDEAG